MFLFVLFYSTNGGFIAMVYNIIDVENTPVSYTHLDVYKRQGYKRVMDTLLHRAHYEKLT